MPKTVPVPFPNKIEISRSYYHLSRKVVNPVSLSKNETDKIIKSFIVII